MPMNVGDDISLLRRAWIVLCRCLRPFQCRRRLGDGEPCCAVGADGAFPVPDLRRRLCRLRSAKPALPTASPRLSSTRGRQEVARADRGRGAARAGADPRQPAHRSPRWSPLYLASNGVEAARTALNRAYRVVDRRSIFLLRGAEPRLRPRRARSSFLRLCRVGVHDRRACPRFGRSSRLFAVARRRGHQRARRRGAGRRAHLAAGRASALVSRLWPGIVATLVAVAAFGLDLRLLSSALRQLRRDLRRPRQRGDGDLLPLRRRRC